MRIRGHWGTFDAPYITAILISAPLGLGQPIRFLIDTGASRTTILDNDVARLKLDYRKLEKAEHSMAGIGGLVDTYIIPGAFLIFIADTGSLEIRLDTAFALRHTVRDPQTRERIRNIPSILGRDILNKYKLVLNRNRGLVLITDEEITLIH